MIPFIVLAAAATACSLAQPDRCGDTSALLRDPAVAAEIRRLVADRRAALLQPRDAPVADQLLEVLGGPPDKRVQLGPHRLFSACRPDSCTEKGAVLLREDGALLGAAVLFTGCGAGSAPICDTSDRRLLVYVAGPIPSDVQSELVRWGESAAGTPGLSQIRSERVTSVPIAVSVDFDGDVRPDRVRLERLGTMSRLVAYRAEQPERGIVVTQVRDPRNVYLRSLGREGAATTGRPSAPPRSAAQSIAFGTDEASMFTAPWNGRRFLLTNQAD